MYAQMLPKIITLALLLAFHQEHFSFYKLKKKKKILCQASEVPYIFKWWNEGTSFLCAPCLIFCGAGFNKLVTTGGKSKILHVHIYKYIIKDERTGSKIPAI